MVSILGGLAAVAGPATAADGPRAVVRFKTDPAKLALRGVKVGRPIFAGHRDWLVFEVTGDIASLRRNRHVEWVERSAPSRVRARAARAIRDPFPGAPMARLTAPTAPRSSHRAAAPGIPAAPSGCTRTAGDSLDTGKPDDPMFCVEGTQPHAYYAEEWNNFCFLPAAQAASVKAAAPRAPDASGMCTQGAWAMGAQGQGTVIAILDTGIDDRNADLANQMLPSGDPLLADPLFPGADHGWNFYDDNGETMDFNGHGTGRAGIAAAQADNGIQMAGVAPKARLMAVKVGDTYVVSGEHAAQGIVYAADHGADVINTSLGVTANSRLLRMAAVYADSKGVVFAAATANEYSNHHNYPTNLDTVTGVTGLGPDDALVPEQTCQSYAPPTNCTPATPQKTFLQKVNYANFGGIADFAAPIDTPSTSRGNPGSSGPHASGTSTAAPHVAGAAAVVRSAGFLAGMCKGHPAEATLTGCDAPALSANEVRQILAFTATRIHNEDVGTHNYPPNPSGDPTAAGGEYYPAMAADPHLGWNQWHGYGRPDLYAAAAYAKSGLVPPEVQLYGDTPPPTPAFQGLTGPVPFAVLTPEKTPVVDIVGHVASRPLPDGQHLEWKVQVAPCLEPATGDFQTIATGQGARDGVLTKWELPTQPASCAVTGTRRPFSPPGTYTIRTIAYAVDGNGAQIPVSNPTWESGVDRDPNKALPASSPLIGQDRRVVTVRPSTPQDRDGSPHYLGASGEGSPTLYDLEGRGELDVIVPTGDGQVRALRPDGTDVPGWPVQIDDLATAGSALHPAKVNGITPSSQIVGSVAIGDLEGDGQPEVVAAALTGGVYAWRRNGARVPGFPVQVPPGPLHQAPADPFAASDPNDEYCVNRHPAVNDQAQSGYGSIAAPVLADVDHPADGTLEIIQAAGNMCVYEIGANGIVRRFFRPKTTPGTPTKIAATPAVGDFDADGGQDIVVGTEEVTGSTGSQKGWLYAYDAATGTRLPGWPVDMPSIAAAGVPTVATGVISSPALLRPDGAASGPMQTVTGAFLQGDPHTPVRMIGHTGAKSTTLATQTNGGGNATDLPFHWGITQTAVGKLGTSDALSVATGGLGTFLAVDTATIPGKKTQFQHLVGAWSATNGAPVPTFPRQIEDWQFLSGPVIASVKADGSRQLIMGSGYGFVHAFDPGGTPAQTNLSTSLSRYVDFSEPPGFPVNTGQGYITSTPAVGQMQRGGKVTVATVTRDGWLFLTETEGRPEANDQWWRFHHDERNTGQYGLDTRPPATVDDLAAEPASPSSARVSWTAVGDDWWVGRPTSVELRWSTSPITDENFGAATRVPSPPADVSGTAQTMVVEGLPAGRRVHFALRSRDDAGNVALLGHASAQLPEAPAGGPATPKPGGTPQYQLPPCPGFQDLRSVSARPAASGRALRLGFRRSGRRPVTIEVLRESVGRSIVRPRRQFRWRDRTSAVTLRRRLAPGSYLARFTLRRADGVTETLRTAFAVRARRYRARGGFAVRDRCGPLERFHVARSVFGGRTRVPLSVAIRLAAPGRVTLELRRRGRVVRRLASRRAVTTRTLRLKVSPARLRRATYSLRLTAEAGGARIVRTVVVRRI